MGITKREIASELGVSKRTVANYIEKLGLGNHVSRNGNTDFLDDFAAAAAALIYRRRTRAPAADDEEPDDDGYDREDYGHEDRHGDGYDRADYGYDDRYRDEIRDRY